MLEFVEIVLDNELAGSVVCAGPASFAGSEVCVKPEVCEEEILGANIVVDDADDVIAELVMFDPDGVRKDDELTEEDVDGTTVVGKEEDTTCSNCVKDIDVKLLAVCNNVTRVD